MQLAPEYVLSPTCAPSRSHCRVQPLELHAGVGGGELPFGFDTLLTEEVTAWEAERNTKYAKADGQLTSAG
jgi:hypothetical protein